MNSIELACSSSAYTDMSLLDAIKHIAEIGYTAIEVRAGHKPLDRDISVGQSDSPAFVVDQLRDELMQHGMAVSNIAVGGHYTKDLWRDNTYQEQIEHYVRIARALNCNSVTICPGASIHTPATLPFEQTSLINPVNRIAKYARGLGVSIGISYGPGLVLQNAEDVRRLILKCRGLKMAFHAGHSHLACETPCVIATNFKHNIKHIHVADVGSNERPYLIPGEGEIEWISFFKTLRWIGYTGYITVDLASYRDMPDLAAMRTYHYLSNIMNALSLKRKGAA